MAVVKTNFLTTLSFNALFLGCLACATPFAQAAETPAPPSYSEKTGEALSKLQPLLNAKDWNGAQTLLDSIISAAPADSYDRAVATEIKAKIYLQNSEFPKALAMLESIISTSEIHKNFFDQKSILEYLYYLAQLYYQEGANSKDLSVQQANFNKALVYLRRWFSVSPKKDADATMFYASILYNQAVVGGDKADLSILKQARHEIEEGLLMAPKPKDGFYTLLLATLQQEGDFARSAEVLEQLVIQKPENKVYWQQLMATYANLAGGGEKDPAKIQEYHARAINSLERAQARGLLKDPKDNYNLVSIYFNAGQFGKATDLLYSGLKNGAIESDVKNYELLAYSYQQVNQELQAVNVLKEATKIFPKNGQLDFLIGQIYTQMDNNASAYEAYEQAVAKGGVEKPYITHVLLAYSAFDLQKLEIALKAVAEAEKFPEAQKDPQLPKMKAAIEEAIKDRIAAKEAAEGKKIN